MCVSEIEEKYKRMLSLLEKLLVEFEQKISLILQDEARRVAGILEFSEREYPQRMAEVCSELEGDTLSENEKQAAEKISVVWQTCQEDNGDIEEVKHDNAGDDEEIEDDETDGEEIPSWAKEYHKPHPKNPYKRGSLDHFLWEIDHI